MWIARYGRFQQEEPPYRPSEDEMLVKGVPSEAQPKDREIFARQAGSAFRTGLETDQASLQRMHVVKMKRRRKGDERLDEAVQRNASRRRAPQDRRHVFRRVIQRPGFAVNSCPFGLGHFGMGGAHVLHVVSVEV